MQGMAQRMFTSAKTGLLVKLDERSCLGGSVTKKYKSSNYGNVTAEVRSARVRRRCPCVICDQVHDLLNKNTVACVGGRA